MSAVEKYYSVTETCLLLSVSADTVLRRIKAGDFGQGVINLSTPERPDYRIPASGINAWAAARSPSSRGDSPRRRGGGCLIGIRSERPQAARHRQRERAGRHRTRRASHPGLHSRAHRALRVFIL